MKVSDRIGIKVAHGRCDDFWLEGEKGDGAHPEMFRNGEFVSDELIVACAGAYPSKLVGNGAIAEALAAPALPSNTLLLVETLVQYMGDVLAMMPGHYTWQMWGSA